MTILDIIIGVSLAIAFVMFIDRLVWAICNCEEE